MCLLGENSEDLLKEVSASMSLYWLYICKWLPSSKALKCMLSSSTAWLQQCWHVWGIHMPGERHMLVCPSGLTNSSLCPSCRPVARSVGAVSSSHRRCWRWQRGCTSSTAPGFLSFPWRSLECRGTDSWKMVWSLPAIYVTLPCLVPMQNLVVFV